MSTILTAEVISVKLSSGIEVSAMVAAQLLAYEYGADADGNRGVNMIDVDWTEMAGPVTSEDVDTLTDDEINEGVARILAASYSHDWQVD